jgi:hypothetical protein
MILSSLVFKRMSAFQKFVQPKLFHFKYSFDRFVNPLNALQQRIQSDPTLRLSTGAFRTQIPNVFCGETHFKRALRFLKVVKPDYKVNNIRNRNRKFTAESLNALMNGLTRPITEVLDIYIKLLYELHPYEVNSFVLSSI